MIYIAMVNKTDADPSLCSHLEIQGPCFAYKALAARRAVLENADLVLSNTEQKSVSIGTRFHFRDKTEVKKISERKTSGFFMPE